jgi:hypothetical protein
MQWLCCGVGIDTGLKFREVPQGGRSLYYLVCVFGLYDQLSFSFSPVFPQLCVVSQ